MANANPLEIACVKGIQATDPDCAYNFVRKFEHRNWIDGESLVQAGKTPEEGGINERFHKIEADLDALGDNVRRAFICVETLRAQLSICLNEIVTILNAKEKDKEKDGKDKEVSKDTKDTKDNTDTKNNKDTKDSKDGKDNQEAKQEKDSKDNKENKEDKDDTDKELKEDTKDGLGAAEKKDEDNPRGRFMPDMFHLGHPLVENLPFVVPPRRSEQRVFIAPDERPMLGERALNEPRTE